MNDLGKKMTTQMPGLTKKNKKVRTFRHTAGFGKRIEYWIIGEMLKAGLDMYVPLVDDDAIDAVIRREDGTFITVQIKARSRDVIDGDAALFAAIPHELRDNYWFIFYSERMDMKWIMTSDEFIRESVQTKPPPPARRWVRWKSWLRTEVLRSRFSDLEIVTPVVGFGAVLLFQVLHDDFIGYIPAAGHEVPSCPQVPTPELFRNVLELHHQLS